MKGKMLVIMPAVLMPLILGGGFLVLSSGGQSWGAPIQIVVGRGQPTIMETPPAEARHGITFSTKERVVTLADTPVLRYLKTEVVLEFAPPMDGRPLKGEEYRKAQEHLAEELAPSLPAIEDAITAVFASRTAEQVATPEGKDRIKAELMERLKGLHLERPLTNIYFTQFIIQ